METHDPLIKICYNLCKEKGDPKISLQPALRAVVKIIILCTKNRSM